MIDFFFDYFGYDREHHFVAGIGYEYVIILNLISRIITINRINIIVCRGFVHFMLGDDGFLGEIPFGTCLICAGCPPRNYIYINEHTGSEASGAPHLPHGGPSQFLSVWEVLTILCFSTCASHEQYPSQKYKY